MKTPINKCTGVQCTYKLGQWTKSLIYPMSLYVALMQMTVIFYVYNNNLVHMK